MFNSVQDYTLSILPPKKKRSQSGWLSFNAACCANNGDSADTRGRGGVMTNPDGGISYHCFNCGWKTSYQPGRPLSFKFRKLLKWLGADANEIQRLVFEALRVKDLISPEDVKPPEEEIVFEPRQLPEQARSFNEMATFIRLQDEDAPLPPEFNRAVEVVYKRLGTQLSKYEFYWTPEVEHKLSHRVIVPFYYKNVIMGYTARAVEDGIKPKYYSNHPAHFVFNLDKQIPDNKFVIVVEGPFDAMAIDGVSVQTNEISEQQAELIEALGKQVIFVPDFDKHVNKQGREVWPGKSAVDQAMEYGWSVSFPVWHEDCKDVSAAVEKYGKLFVLKSIVDSRESNRLKIELMKRKIHA
jgi:hypothetical protein